MTRSTCCARCTGSCVRGASPMARRGWLRSSRSAGDRCGTSWPGSAGHRGRDAKRGRCTYARQPVGKRYTMGAWYPFVYRTGYEYFPGGRPEDWKVRRADTGAEVALTRHPKGRHYWMIGRPSIDRRPFARAVVVCTHFHGPRPAGMECAHLNGDPSDDRPENLRWVTRQENQAHRVAHGTSCQGERAKSAKLTEAAVREIRGSNEGRQVLAARYGVTPKLVDQVRRRTTWKHVR
jgi:hypothetical protein